MNAVRIMEMTMLGLDTIKEIRKIKHKELVSKNIHLDLDLLFLRNVFYEIRAEIKKNE